MIRVVALLILPAVLAAGLLGGGARLVGTDPVVGQAVVWGGRTFVEPSDLGRWLAARGAEYEQWASRHPSAAARLEGRTPPEPPSPTTAAQPKHDARAETRGAAQVRNDPGFGFPVDFFRATTALVAALGVGLVVVGAIPALAVAVRAERVVDHRAHLVAAGISLLVGVAAGGAL